MKYKTMHGVIMTQICGTHFIVTPEKTMQINETAAFCWKQMEQGVDEEELCQRMQEAFDIEDPELLRSDIRSLTESMYVNHLLVRYGQ